MSRPDRYPIKITVKSTGRGLTSPRVGDHYISDNEPFMIGVAEGSLKYWKIDGEIAKGKVHTLQVHGKDIVAEAFFSEETPPDLSLKEVEPIIAKDIKTVEGITVKTFEGNKGKPARRNIRKTEEKEK